MSLADGVGRHHYIQPDSVPNLLQVLIVCGGTKDHPHPLAQVSKLQSWGLGIDGRRVWEHAGFGDFKTETITDRGELLTDGRTSTGRPVTFARTATAYADGRVTRDAVQASEQVHATWLIGCAEPVCTQVVSVRYSTLCGALDKHTTTARTVPDLDRVWVLTVDRLRNLIPHDTP